MPSASWTNGWLTGDIVTAAEFKKGVGAIYDTTLGADAASVDITGIVAGYAHLRLVCYLRSSFAATAVNVGVRLNNDATAAYDYGNVTDGAAVSEGNTTYLQCGVIPGSSAPANSWGAVDLILPHYAGTVNHKVGRAQSIHRDAAASVVIADAGGVWLNTAAVNRVTVLPLSGNFVAGSRVTLYAMGA